MVFTSESVSEGHPDKICDQVSDAVLDKVLESDPMGRVACECFATTGMIVVGGEIGTNTYIDLPRLVRQVIEDIGYTDPALHFEASSVAVINVINGQSSDIDMGVSIGGAGDQGMMFGYACRETDEYMPTPIYYAHKLVKRLADIRKNEPSLITYLRPDSKAQVSVQYENGKPVSIPAVVVSTQHAEVDLNGRPVTNDRIKADIIEKVIKTVIPEHLLSPDIIYHINPTGRFVIGGPHGDTGLTGRKIIVDTYGGRAPHGGGAFSGKDPTKVDRSAAYAARFIAKNLVAAGVADECTIQLAYAIGVKEPVSVHVHTNGTGKVSNTEIANYLIKNVDLTPEGIITQLNLRSPIYRETAAYGHFGRHHFPWERLDLTEQFTSALL
ncbi:MAG: methionine adenosyltransferase [Flavobacteriales bacterium]|nr:MAG: methionine adenosyltransferase [Bacteroidota bacterium]KXK34405.1 MAG: S-adenosylmethionine synthetase [Chlorobi bacterium OLB6]MBE2265311.1 methionine adenosyltransferase [Flavobacteriales bacterium]MBZ0194780.1 methionine adenosyltransferase [Candidatus Kapabacteria bacterium]